MLFRVIAFSSCSCEFVDRVLHATNLRSTKSHETKTKHARKKTKRVDCLTTKLIILLLLLLLLLPCPAPLLLLLPCSCSCSCIHPHGHKVLRPDPVASSRRNCFAILDHPPPSAIHQIVGGAGESDGVGSDHHRVTARHKSPEECTQFRGPARSSALVGSSNSNRPGCW